KQAALLGEAKRFPHLLGSCPWGDNFFWRPNRDASSLEAVDELRPLPSVISDSDCDRFVIISSRLYNRLLISVIEGKCLSNLSVHCPFVFVSLWPRVVKLENPLSRLLRPVLMIR